MTNNIIKLGQIYRVWLMPKNYNKFTYGLVIYTDALRTQVQLVDDVYKRPNPLEASTKVAACEWELICDVKPHRIRSKK